MGASSVERHEALLNIGQVLDLLRPDFPDITIPKIRFWEGEGLIKPQRTPAGYRKFSDHDVERLRYVLRMKRDHYLPLGVIREHLDAIDRGLEPPQIDAVVPTVPKVALAADGLPAAESFRRVGQLPPVTQGAGEDRGDRRRPAGPARVVRPHHAGTDRATTTPTRW